MQHLIMGLALLVEFQQNNCSTWQFSSKMDDFATAREASSIWGMKGNLWHSDANVMLIKFMDVIELNLLELLIHSFRYQAVLLRNRKSSSRYAGVK